MRATVVRRLAWAALFVVHGAACSGGRLYRNLAEPLSVEDYEPVPTAVTMENARLVVRRCLQSHRRSSATPESEYGYVFRERGFVQLRHFSPFEREEERAGRIYVDYKALSDVRAEPRYNLNRLREEFRVTLRGAFRQWESHVRTFRAQPDLDDEEGTVGVGSLVLDLDDPVFAHRLVEALRILAAS